MAAAMGATTPSDGDLSQWGDDVKALCDALEIERPIVMGVSFGGYVAMSYALRHPDHPAKLILCSTAASPSKKAIQVKVFERLGGAEAGAAASAFIDDPIPQATREFWRLCAPLYHRSPYDPESDARTIWNPRLMAEFRRGERETMNFLSELHWIKCPTLVMVGEDDPMTPVPCSEEIVAALPVDLVRFERFADAGHGIVSDQPGRFFEVLRTFHSRLNGRIPQRAPRIPLGTPSQARRSSSNGASATLIVSPSSIVARSAFV